MPLRSVKMNRFIFGFQRRVWWPKCTPLSSSCFMETTWLVAVLAIRLALLALRPACGRPAPVGFVAVGRVAVHVLTPASTFAAVRRTVNEPPPEWAVCGRAKSTRSRRVADLSVRRGAGQPEIAAVIPSPGRHAGLSPACHRGRRAGPGGRQARAMDLRHRRALSLLGALAWLSAGFLLAAEPATAAAGWRWPLDPPVTVVAEFS